ncbi:hypothetical protein KBB06_03215 [Candidatus Gracilibacteria bacterium]|nr:hypothetical protein [Candidatus Gracilibacteria bacterium]
MKYKNLLCFVVCGLSVVFFSSCQSQSDIVVPAANSSVETQTQIKIVTDKTKLEDCRDIEDRSFRNFCEGFVIAATAKSASDFAVCDSAGSVEVKDLCLSYVKEKK